MSNSKDSEIFLTKNWLDKLFDKLNSDSKYAEIAKNWEGDMGIYIEGGGPLKIPVFLYFDLWHGTCRKVDFLHEPGDIKPAFLLTASFENIEKIVYGKLDPLQAMMTRRLQVKGSMAYMMRNVPTVIDFVRCVREITSD
jgi:putative sterol carrier protein